MAGGTPQGGTRPTSRVLVPMVRGSTHLVISCLNCGQVLALEGMKEMWDLWLTFKVAALDLLVTILPDSPISDWLESVSMADSAIAKGLGWLNWFADINAMLILMGLWLTAVGVYYAAKYGLSIFGGLRGLARDVFTTITG